jgi:hypothetical protein
MFYWLDSFTQCLLPFVYADLIKWIDGLTGWPDTVSRPAWRAYAIVVTRVHLARVGRRLASIDVQRINLK